MRKLIPLILLFALVNWACTQSEKKEETKKDTAQEQAAVTPTIEISTDKKIVAKVNGRPIYKDDLHGRPLRMVINEEILYQEGLKKGLDKQFEGQADDYKKALIIESVRREFMANLPQDKEVEITDEEIEEFYKKHQDRYRFISIKEIITEDKTTAEEIRNKLIKGENLVVIQSEFGDKATISNSRFTRGHFKLFDKIEVGSVTEIMEDGNSFKIFQVTNVREIPLAQAKSAIKHNIIARRKGKALRQKVEEIKKENNIEVEVLSKNQGATEGEDEAEQ